MNASLTISKNAALIGQHKFTIQESGATLINYGKIDIKYLMFGSGNPILNNFGEIFVSDKIESTGTIINESPIGYIETNDLIIKAPALTNKHHLKINNNLTITGTGKIINTPTGVIQILNDALIEHNNVIDNDGKLFIDGTLNGPVWDGGKPIIGEGTTCSSDGSSSPSGSQDCDGKGIDGSLPIELLNFEANNTNSTVVINWSTATEENNDYFTIEHSEDGEYWETVEIISGAGNSNTIINYSIIDRSPYAKHTYYRLMQTDYDGKYTFSKIVAINNSKSSTDNISIYPNPASDIINIDGIENTNELTIYNSVGQVVNSDINITKISEDSLKINISELPTGFYFVKTPTQTIKLIKQ